MLGTIGWVIVIGMIAAAVVIGPWLAGRFAARRRKELRAQARNTFRQRREWLEAKFFDLAATSGKPRGFSWADCDFQDEVSYVVDRGSGDLLAMVGVTVRFQAAKEDGLEQDVTSGVSYAATAVFRFSGGGWMTDGRAIFNLEPGEAIRYFRGTLDVLAE